MIKRLAILASFAFLVACGSVQDKVNDEKTITVSGSVGYPQQTGMIVIQEITEEGNGWMDTIQLAPDYTFRKEIKIDEPGYYRINFYNRQSVDLILSDSDVQVNVDGNSPNGFVRITGSPELELIQQVQMMAQRIRVNPDIGRLDAAYREAMQRGDTVHAKEIQQEYIQLERMRYDSIAQVIKDAPPSLAVINLLQGGLFIGREDQYTDLFSSVADKLKEKMPGSTHAQNFIATVERMKAVAVGEVAPEIALPNPDGEIVKLSSLRGKYVLVDFWAYWCGPCRRENPNIVKAYQKYKDKGFEIYGVSLDRNREDWLKAIADDGLHWTQVSDLKYFQSEAARTYNINAIPFSILVDPNGVIVGKNLRDKALHEKLEALLGS